MEHWQKVVRKEAIRLQREWDKKHPKPKRATRAAPSADAEGNARLDERDERRTIEFQTFAQSYLGDPPFARSALGQKVAALFET